MLALRRGWLSARRSGSKPSRSLGAGCCWPAPLLTPAGRTATPAGKSAPSEAARRVEAGAHRGRPGLSRTWCPSSRPTVELHARRATSVRGDSARATTPTTSALAPHGGGVRGGGEAVCRRRRPSPLLDRRADASLRSPERPCGSATVPRGSGVAAPPPSASAGAEGLVHVPPRRAALVLETDKGRKRSPAVSPNRPSTPRPAGRRSAFCGCVVGCHRAQRGAPRRG